MIESILLPSATKGWCPYCRTELKVPDGHADPIMICPMCGHKVALRASRIFRENTRNRKAWWASVLLLLLTIGVLGYYYRGHITSGFGFLAGTTGGNKSAALSLAFAVLIIVCVFFWMIFPILVWCGLKDLRRRTAELDQTTRLCVHHLAQLSAQQDIAKSDSSPEQKKTGVPPPGNIGSA